MRRLRVGTSSVHARTKFGPIPNSLNGGLGGEEERLDAGLGGGVRRDD